MDSTTVGERGQVVIPKPIRDKLNLTKGTTLITHQLDDNTIVLKKLDRKKLLEEFERLREEAQPKIPYEEILKEVRAYRDERSNRH